MQKYKGPLNQKKDAAKKETSPNQNSTQGSTTSQDLAVKTSK